MKKQFHNIESLRTERMRLEVLCKEKEAELTQSLEYVQEHFGSLIISSLLPFSREQKDMVGGIIDKVQHYIGKLMPGEDSKWHAKLAPVMKIVQMVVAGLVYKYVKRAFR